MHKKKTLTVNLRSMKAHLLLLAISLVILVPGGFCNDPDQEEGFNVLYPTEALQHDSKGKNVPEGPDPSFFIDGNQGKGKLLTVFRNDGRLSRDISGCFLVMNVSKTKNSGSGSTFRVYLSDKVIGQKKGAKNGRIMKIAVDAKAFKGMSQFELSVRTGGSDGLRLTAAGPGRPRLWYKYGTAEGDGGGDRQMITPGFDMSALKPVPVKKGLTYIHGLLVASLGNSRYAAQSSKLSLSALPLNGDTPASISFNQPVGSMMTDAAKEVLRFHALRHSGWPKGTDVQFAFAEKYSSKDGPSAAVACGLLIESMLTGVDLRTDLAVTGDMNADGTVQPVGGVRAKIRGAVNGGMKLVAIPVKNRVDVLDLLIADGPSLLTKTQVFSISTFDEALAVARQDGAPKIAEAIALFDQVAAGKVKGQAATDALKSIVENAPNHISAKLLLSYMSRNVPKKLSLRGSLDEIDDSVAAVIEATSSDLSATSNLDSGQVSKVTADLQRLRVKIDDRLRPYCDAWIEWARVVDRVLGGSTVVKREVAQLKAAAKKIDAEREAIRGNESIQDELMR